MAISYIALPNPRYTQFYEESIESSNDTSGFDRGFENGDEAPSPINNNEIDKTPIISSSDADSLSVRFRNFLLLLRQLAKYMIPLFLVYYAEYFINQGLYELAYFRDDKVIPDHKTQYR